MKKLWMLAVLSSFLGVPALAGSAYAEEKPKDACCDMKKGAKCDCVKKCGCDKDKSACTCDCGCGKKEDKKGV